MVRQVSFKGILVDLVLPILTDVWTETIKCGFESIPFRIVVALLSCDGVGFSDRGNNVEGFVLGRLSNVSLSLCLFR